MSKYDLTVCQPAIHPKYWPEYYETLCKSCTKYSFELIFIGPHSPEELLSKPNVRYIKSYASSTVASQIGVEAAEGKLVAIPADDGRFFPSGFDEAIKLYDQQNSNKDVIVLRFREGSWIENFVYCGVVHKRAAENPPEYWTCRPHGLFPGHGWYSPGINQDYKLAIHPLMSVEYFKEIGGFDCRFEHVAYALNDLSIRAQNNGSVYHLSPIEVEDCDWRPGSEEHLPIEASAPDDQALFMGLYADVQAGQSRTKIPYDNWKDAPEVWSRRWPNGVTE